LIKRIGLSKNLLVSGRGLELDRMAGWMNISFSAFSMKRAGLKLHDQEDK